MDERGGFVSTGERKESTLTVEDLFVVVLKVVEEAVPFFENHGFNFGECCGVGDEEGKEVVVRGQGAVGS